MCSRRDGRVQDKTALNRPAIFIRIRIDPGKPVEARARLLNSELGRGSWPLPFHGPSCPGCDLEAGAEELTSISLEA